MMGLKAFLLLALIPAGSLYFIRQSHKVVEVNFIGMFEALQLRMEPQKCSGGWNHSPVKTGKESWDCSAWIREGSRETLLQSFST